MKTQNRVMLGSIMSLVFFAGQVSAEVSDFTSNNSTQTVTSTAKWLDLSSGLQFIGCFFESGPAAVSFSAETSWTAGPGGALSWLNARIWVSGGIGFLASTDFAFDSAKGTKLDWGAHSTVIGFDVPNDGWYSVGVHARSVGANSFGIDDLKLVCMD